MADGQEGGNATTLLPCRSLGNPWPSYWYIQFALGAGSRGGERDGTNQVPIAQTRRRPSFWPRGLDGCWRYCERCSIHDPLPTSRKLAPLDSGRGFLTLLSFSSPARPRHPVRLQILWLSDCAVRKHERLARIRLADEAPCSCQETILSRYLVSNNSDEIVLMTTEVSTPCMEGDSQSWLRTVPSCIAPSSVLPCACPPSSLYFVDPRMDAR